MYIGFTAFCQEEVALAFAKNPAAASRVKAYSDATRIAIGIARYRPHA